MKRHAEDFCQALAAALAGLALLWSGWELRGTVIPDGTARPATSLAGLQDAAGLAASAAGAVVLGWWLLAASAAVLSAVLARFGRIRAAGAVARLCPGFLRRLAAAAVGVQLIAGPVPAALAGPGEATAPSAVRVLSADESSGEGVDPSWHPATVETQEPAAGVDPGWKPAPGPVPGSLLVPPGYRSAVPAPETVTVIAGDTLWDLAAAQLGPLATDTEIAELWPRWFELNRSVLTAGPDLLFPGQVLAVPQVPAG